MSEGLTVDHITALAVLLRTRGTARVYDSADGKTATYTYRVGKTLCLDIWNGLQKLYDGTIEDCPYPTPKEIGTVLQSELNQIYTTPVITHNCP
jgi:hypothetical protein